MSAVQSVADLALLDKAQSMSYPRGSSSRKENNVSEVRSLIPMLRQRSFASIRRVRVTLEPRGIHIRIHGNASFAPMSFDGLEVMLVYATEKADERILGTLRFTRSSGGSWSAFEFIPKGTMTVHVLRFGAVPLQSNVRYVLLHSEGRIWKFENPFFFAKPIGCADR